MKKQLINFYDIKAVKDMNSNSYNPGFPNTDIEIPARVALQGCSGSGKTTILLNYIYLTNDTWAHIYIVTKSTEPLYEFLQKQLKYKNIDVYYDISKLPSPKDLPKPEEQKLVIFDDCVSMKNQSTIIDYFIYGRKKNITSFYLSQNYYSIPKAIRAQFSYLIIVKVGQKRDLNLILADSGGLIEKEELRRLYDDATKEKFNFLKINLNTADMNKKFTKNFNDFYLLDKKNV
jgi:ABC-type oligopeptide transport system ATPase subunit